MHDVLAYPLLAAVSCLSVAGSRLHRVAWLLATLGAAWLALQVALGWGLVRPGDFDTWEWERFRGLSDNANQLALFCAVLGLISLYLAEVARELGERAAAVTCMVVAIIVGRLTKSDAFLLVLDYCRPNLRRSQAPEMADVAETADDLAFRVRVDPRSRSAAGHGLCRPARSVCPATSWRISSRE